MKIGLLTRWKILVIFLLIAYQGISAPDPAAKLQAKEQYLIEVLDEISEEHNVYFTYDSDMIKDVKVEYERKEGESIRSVLDRVLKEVNFGFKIFEDRFVIIYKNDDAGIESLEQMIRHMEGIVSARKNAARKDVKVERLYTPTALEVYNKRLVINVSGTIQDEVGEPLIGVNVLVKGTDKGTATDFEGNFTLEDVDDQAVLVVSYIGYQTQEVALNGKHEITITLLEGSQTLDEVVVVGYGTQSREVLTTSITKLDNKVLENVPYGNAATALQGSVSGVRVQSLTGQPGAAPRVIVRGGTSINNPNGASPLYIVDGVIRSLSNIAAEDIESIQVLKDAAATSIYGARGSNGVVLITTKSGNSGETRVEFKSSLTASNVTRLYDLASAEDYIRLGRLGTAAVGKKIPSRLERLDDPIGYGTGNDFTKNTDYTTMYLTEDNRHKLNEGWQSIPDPLDPTKTIIFKETDFQSLAMRTGMSYNNHLRISGGTDKATFNAGIGYLDSEGIAITTFYKRLTLNLNGQLKVNDKLKFSANTLFAESVDNRLASDSWIFWGAATRPTAKYSYEDGTLTPGRINQGNPDYHLPNRDAENRDYNITLSLGSEWDILPGLTFEPLISLNNSIRFDRSFQPSYGNGFGTINSTRQSNASDGRTLQTQADGIFSYANTFGKHHDFSLKTGASYYKRGNYNFSATGQGASTDLISTLNASSQYTSLSSSLSDQVIFGYFSSLNYNYARKYLLTLNARYDGASNLGKENKWGFFPGASIGWNIHKEEFWNSVPDLLSRMKTRVSYGINGNISLLGDFTSQGTYDAGGQYAGGPIIVNNGIPNPNLKWERSKTLNFGVDLGLFEDRVSVIFDIYRRVTEDLITTLSLPASTGFSGVLTNLGSLENKGIELELNADVLRSVSDFNWNIGFNISKVKNTIKSLPANGQENNRIGGFYVWDSSIGDYNWLGGLQEGGTMGDYFVYKQIGVYATDEEAENAPVDMVSPTSDKTKHGGDVIWLDKDNNGVIDTRDRAYVGNQYPVWTGGLTNYFTYKNLNFSFRMDYATGHTIYNYGRAFYDINLDGDNVMTQRMADLSWKEQGDVTNVPRYYWQDATEFNIRRGNSEYYESGNYLSLREVTLSYRISENLLKSIGIKDIKLNITGNNLHYFTNFSGINPEFGGTEFGRYPIPKNIIFGLNITL